MKEKLAERLEALKSRRDDMVTLEEIGIDQIIVDEAQEFRKLSFATNQVNLKGVDPDGSQRAWDLFVKSRYLDASGPRPRADPGLGHADHQHAGRDVHAAAVPGAEALRERGVHEFDAWASAFGDTSTELELQPSGSLQAGRALRRVHQRRRADDDVPLGRGRGAEDRPARVLTLPALKGGQRQLVTAPASQAFKDYQRILAERIDGDRIAHGPRSEGR